MKVASESDFVPGVQPSGPPGDYIHVDDGPEKFGAQVGQAEQQLGNVVGQAGDQAMQQAIAWQHIQNETQVNDTYANKFSPQFRDTMNKYYQLQGKDAVDQMPVVMKQLEDMRNDTRDTIDNPEQQRMFDQMSRKRVEIELDGMSRYADQQNKVWRDDTHKSTLFSYRNDAAAKWNDEAFAGGMEKSAAAEVEAYGLQTGRSSEWIRANTNVEISNIAQDRVRAAAVHDPMKALDLYRQALDQGKILGTQRDDMEKMLKAATYPVMARETAQNVMSGNPIADPNKLVAAVTQAESGGDATAVSKKGALGLMQILPGTAEDMSRKLGIPFDKDLLTANTPEGRAYNTQLGTAYLKEQLLRYGGNQTLALAAYNAGPDRVDSWLQRNGNPLKGEISEQDWAAQIPFKETRDYVQKINAKVDTNPGTPATSKDIGAHYQAWVNNADRFSTAVAPGDPVFRDMVVDRIGHYVGVVQRGIQANEKQAWQTVAGEMFNPKNGTPPTSMEDLRSRPGVAAALNILPDTAYQSINIGLDHNARGIDPPANPENLGTYYQLKGLAARDPEAFMQKDISQYFGTLPHALSHELIGLQTTLNTRQVKDELAAQNLAHAREVVAPSLKAAGINPSAKSGTAAAAQYDQFLGRMQQSLRSYYENNKKRPDDAAITGMAKSLLVQGAQSDSGTFWDTKMRAFQTDPDKFYVPVPKDEAVKIKSDWQTVHPGQVPTELQVRQVYTASQLRAAAKASK